jgi:hypothetical protein
MKSLLIPFDNRLFPVLLVQQASKTRLPVVLAYVPPRRLDHYYYFVSEICKASLLVHDGLIMFHFPSRTNRLYRLLCRAMALAALLRAGSHQAGVLSHSLVKY